MNYEEHARADFTEMLAHGCDTVILAITEFDMDFWFPNLRVCFQTQAYEINQKSYCKNCQYRV